ncbi:hypothetical protein RND81_08G169200 [Saponaria officinalis]|uniref:BAG family molecular chaperone regulator 8, chloroplastic n=1 Tax=Saponaria officinalis TaxID=3572 RepID=A0AAW1J969_SAPOF
MAYHHHHHQQNHHSTTQSCCCQPQPPSYHSLHPQPPPPSPPPTFDPFLIETIVSQVLQSQTLLNHTHQLHSPHHFVPSLLRRLHHLETSLNNLSSSSSYPPIYLRDAAARVIQTHFRVFLVRRSRTLGMLKLLARVKSTLNRLQSSFSLHGFVDFDSFSRNAMDLLLFLDSIQGEDQMIRDSKKSITREIVQFLEMVDGVCVKRHQVMTRKIKSMKLVKNDKARSGHISKGYSERAEGSKGRNVDEDEEKKLIENLRERVERIGKMSRELEKDDESPEFEHLGDEDKHIKSKYGLNNGGSNKKKVPFSDGKKHVCFVEDGDKIRVGRDVDEMEDTSKGRQDEEEAHSDGGQSSSQSSEERSNRSYEVDARDKDFTFPSFSTSS